LTTKRLKINVRENRRSNQEWTLQTHWQQTKQTNKQKPKIPLKKTKKTTR
jgi:hypothetical protein